MCRVMLDGENIPWMKYLVFLHSRDTYEIGKGAQRFESRVVRIPIPDLGWLLLPLTSSLSRSLAFK